MKLVLDTQVWLDWLVFEDAEVVPLRNAVALKRVQVLMDEACAAELERVLAYDLGKHSIDAQAQASCLAICRQTVVRIEGIAAEAMTVQLPLCRDPDDQKFLEAALAARADFLVTKDQALLELARRVREFRILTPAEFAQVQDRARSTPQ